jgi:hypothetical protein
MSEVLEKGEIFFLYRPKVDTGEAGGKKDVARLHIILDPKGGKGKKMRRLIVGEKQLPKIKNGGRRNWAFVEEVTSSKKKMSEKAQREEYETKTRGTREEPPERPAGEGVYAIVRHEDHNHLAYRLELPKSPGKVQKGFNIEKEGDFVLSVKNPKKESPKGMGLQDDQKAELPKKLQARFKDRRFLPADPDFLEQEGVELMLIGARDDEVAKELGIKLDPDSESQQSSDLLRRLDLPEEEHPRDPLMKGEWE